MTQILTSDKAGRVKLPKEVLDRLDAKPDLKMCIRDLPDGKFVIEIGYDSCDLVGIIKDREIRKRSTRQTECNANTFDCYRYFCRFLPDGCLL